jgi:hypothetical protein
MRTGRPKQALILTDEERDRLQSLAHRARSQSLMAAFQSHRIVFPNSQNA